MQLQTLKLVPWEAKEQLAPFLQLLKRQMVRHQLSPRRPPKRPRQKRS